MILLLISSHYILPDCVMTLNSWPLPLSFLSSRPDSALDSPLFLVLLYFCFLLSQCHLSPRVWFRSGGLACKVRSLSPVTRLAVVCTLRAVSDHLSLLKNTHNVPYSTKEWVAGSLEKSRTIYYVEETSFIRCGVVKPSSRSRLCYYVRKRYGERGLRTRPRGVVFERATEGVCGQILLWKVEVVDDLKGQK